MSRTARILAAAVAVAAALCALPARSFASSTQASILMDDDQLIYSTPQHVTHTMHTLAWLGVDVVKVSVVWQLIAPDSTSSHKPRFDATDPAAYPRGAWSRYDLIVQLAQQLGMKVYFQLTPPIPDWAVARGLPQDQGDALGHAPNLTDFKQFVQAVGRRYSGAYVDPSTVPSSSSSSSTVSVSTPAQSVTVPGLTSTQSSSPPSQSSPLPRVNYWGVWNEPNFPNWLNPWHLTNGGVREMSQPALYRGIFDAAYSGLTASDHPSDTILVGETANFGNVSPIPFVEDLYCVNSSYAPLSGRAAEAVGCPTSGSRASFMSQNPGLFTARYAHHPYGFNTPPNQPYQVKSFVTLNNIGWLERVLNGIFSSYGRPWPGGVPLYLTEWGYITNPPNPESETTLTQQAVWLDQGEYMTWRDSYVRALDQFLLVDDGPRTEYPKSSPLYWHTFTTGLLFHNGQAKPAYAAYRIPIWLPVARHGSRVAVWGQLRPADHGTAQQGVIEFRPRGSNRWTQLVKVQTDSPEGFIYNHVSVPGPGSVRLGWLEPSGKIAYSRAASIA